MTNWPFDKDCSSYSQGTGTSEFWKEQYEFVFKQNRRFRDIIEEMYSVIEYYSDQDNECLGDYRPPNKARDFLKDNPNFTKPLKPYKGEE